MKTKIKLLILFIILFGLIMIFNPGTTKAFVLPTYKVGDVNLDGKIDSDDALELGNYINGNAELTGYKKQIADVNGDGVLNEDDANMISKYAIKEISSFPATIPTYLPGDVNLDGKVDMEDSTMVSKSTVSMEKLTPIQKIVADVNGDFKIDGSDVNYISEYAIGKMTSFPSENRMIGDFVPDGVIDVKDLAQLKKILIKEIDIEEKYDPDIFQAYAHIDLSGEPDIRMVTYMANTIVKINNGERYNALNTIKTFGKLDFESDDSELTSYDAYLLISSFMDSNTKLTLWQTISLDMDGDGTVTLNDALRILTKVVNSKNDTSLKDHGISIDDPIVKEYFKQLEKFELGDANCDGEIQAYDALWILNYISGRISKEEVGILNLVLADIDKDGKITSYDALQTLQKSVGKLEEKDAVYEVITGDMNGDGKLTQEDIDIFKKLKNNPAEATFEQLIASSMSEKNKFFTDNDLIILTERVIRNGQGSSAKYEKIYYTADEFMQVYQAYDKLQNK